MNTPQQRFIRKVTGIKSRSNTSLESLTKTTVLRANRAKNNWMAVEDALKSGNCTNANRGINEVRREDLWDAFKVLDETADHLCRLTGLNRGEIKQD